MNCISHAEFDQNIGVSVFIIDTAFHSISIALIYWIIIDFPWIDSYIVVKSFCFLPVPRESWPFFPFYLLRLPLFFFFFFSSSIFSFIISRRRERKRERERERRITRPFFNVAHCGFFFIFFFFLEFPSTHAHVKALTTTQPRKISCKINNK